MASTVRFDERFLDEIKSRLRPSDVIGRTVKLRRQGREYVGLSPFNKEKTPSFYVNDDKGMFFDFSSGKTGDLISFLQETERLTFVEAVERLARGGRASAARDRSARGRTTGSGCRRGLSPNGWNSPAHRGSEAGKRGVPRGQRRAPIWNSGACAEEANGRGSAWSFCAAQGARC